MYDMKSVRVAVMGCGYWGKNLVRNFRSLGALAAVCDNQEVGRRTATELAPGIPVLASFEELLGRPEVHAIAFATPAETHHRLALTALRAGKDVFVEKPLALAVEHGEELCAEALRLGRILMVGHLLQYHPCVQRLLGMVGQGELGRLQYITSNRLNLGKIRREENALWSFAPHDLSVILALAGGQLPIQVRCVGEAWLRPGIADTTLTALKFNGGLRAHVFVSWLNPFKEQKLTVVGSQGMLVFDDTRPWAEKLVFHPQPVTWTQGQIPTPSKSGGQAVLISESEPLSEECRHFIACCEERRAPRTDGDEGLRVLRVLRAAQSSLDLDGDAVATVQISDFRGAAGDLPGAHSIGSDSPARAADDWYAHPTAVVDPGAQIGPGTRIWHFAHICGRARIGRKCVLGQNTFVADDVVLGDNVKVQNNVAIYTGVIVESDVFLGPSCVLTNVTNPRSQVNRHKLYERTLIRRGASIGANATIVPGVELGAYCFVAAGAVVTKNVPGYALMKGVPARRVGWMSRHGHPLDKPGPDGIMYCPESKLRYRVLETGNLECMDVGAEDPLPTGMDQSKIDYRSLQRQSLYRKV